MQDEQTVHAPSVTQPGKGRGKRRGKAALHLFLLLGLPLILMGTVFLTGAYWGSSKIPRWLLEKEASWLGWKVKPEVMQAAQRIQNRRNGLGAPSLAFTNGVDNPPKSELDPARVDSPTPQPAEPPAKEGQEPAPQSESAKKPAPTQAASALKAPEPPEPAPAKPKPELETERDRTPTKGAAAEQPDLQALAEPARRKNPSAPVKEPASAKAWPSKASERATTMKERFELPAKVGVMLVVDAQAFPGAESCQRARAALHSANIQFRAWLNVSLEARGCLPWVAKSEKPGARGQALAALDLPGTDVLMVLSRPGRIELPSLAIERDVFNAGLGLALVPGGADDAALRRALMHALALAMGARPIKDPASPDAKRGSVMNQNSPLRRDWLDEPNRWRLLERKQWPFARRTGQGGGR